MVDKGNNYFNESCIYIYDSKIFDICQTKSNIYI